jgi:NADPH:quinone reductase-like Zn-dependent oxidoreductase
MLESTDQLSLTLNGLSIALVGLLGIYLYRQKITPLDILQDLLIIFKFACYFIYTVSELVFKNFIIPGFFLRKDINGQTVLITGAAGGIGKSLAKKFLGLGAHVICCDISKSLLNELEAELKQEKTSGRIFCYEFDVTSSGEVAEVAQQIRSEVGKVDILVNNAGVQNAKLFLDLTEKDVNRLFG